MTVIQVAAGLIHREGRYLIARRKPGVHLGGFWEFPGGKREPGETLEECLQRELFEELNVRIDVPIPYQIVRHAYPEKIVELHFFHCTIETGEASPIECTELRWVFPEELSQFRFPPADEVILDALRRDAGGSLL
ncbi:MAG TPA: (deoxy)nucleoside triphosphate pyrophosphohydrolase [Nitrospira sp.]|nr:(deoxy)nucleoside triphosphate pyrophosphohydrolase [Nitrospira sp.]